MSGVREEIHSGTTARIQRQATKLQTCVLVELCMRIRATKGSHTKKKIEKEGEISENRLN